ncbi:MAG: hypothetical protein KGI94_03095 [Paracoccaceae bacterium]|nr:hypothetical protein [Paracoccaceae bacterium]MDE3121487.1 hypothetical protein [Paracoccaceae bacterium]
MRRLILLLAFLAGPAAALQQRPMTAAEFDAYSLGKTLYYAVGGKPYGAESYLANRRVIWAFLGQPCKTGYWYPAKDDICFVYDGETHGAQCWRFYAGPNGLSAHFTGDPTTQDLIEVRQSPAPLACPGPKVGV